MGFKGRALVRFGWLTVDEGSTKMEDEGKWLEREIPWPNVDERARLRKWRKWRSTRAWRLTTSEWSTKHVLFFFLQASSFFFPSFPLSLAPPLIIIEQTRPDQTKRVETRRKTLLQIIALQSAQSTVYRLQSVMHMLCLCVCIGAGHRVGSSSWTWSSGRVRKHQHQHQHEHQHDKCLPFSCALMYVHVMLMYGHVCSCIIYHV